MDAKTPRMTKCRALFGGRQLPAYGEHAIFLTGSQRNNRESGLCGELIPAAGGVDVSHEGEKVEYRDSRLFGVVQEFLQRFGDEGGAVIFLAENHGGLQSLQLGAGTTECNGFQLHGCYTLTGCAAKASSIIRITANSY